MNNDFKSTLKIAKDFDLQNNSKSNVYVISQDETEKLKNSKIDVFAISKEETEKLKNTFIAIEGKEISKYEHLKQQLTSLNITIIN